MAAQVCVCGERGRVGERESHHGRTAQISQSPVGERMHTAHLGDSTHTHTPLAPLREDPWPKSATPSRIGWRQFALGALSPTLSEHSDCTVTQCRRKIPPSPTCVLFSRFVVISPRAQPMLSLHCKLARWLVTQRHSQGAGIDSQGKGPVSTLACWPRGRAHLL